VSISTTPVTPTAPPSVLPTNRECTRRTIEKSSKQAAPKGPQLRSRFDKILNVPQRVRLRFSLTCGLVGCLFEQPAAGELSETAAREEGLICPRRAFHAVADDYSPTRVLISARSVSCCCAAQVSRRGNK